VSALYDWRIICYFLDLMSATLETSELLPHAAVEAKSLSRAAAELGAPRATSRKAPGAARRRGSACAAATYHARVALTKRLTLSIGNGGSVSTPLSRKSGGERAERRPGHPGGGRDVRIAMPPMMEPSFNALVCDLTRAYPEVQIHVALVAACDLLREGYDVALRAGTELEPGSWRGPWRAPSL